MELHKGKGNRPTTIQVELTTEELALIGVMSKLVKDTTGDIAGDPNSKPAILLDMLQVMLHIDTYNGLMQKMMKVATGLEEAENQ